MTDTEKQARELELEYAQWCATAKSKPNLYDKMCWWHDRALKLAAYGSSEYERGLRDGRDAAAQIVENAIIPESFRKSSMYTEFEQGGDEILKPLAAAIRQISEGG